MKSQEMQDRVAGIHPVLQGEFTEVCHLTTNEGAPT